MTQSITWSKEKMLLKQPDRSQLFQRYTPFKVNVELGDHQSVSWHRYIDTQSPCSILFHEFEHFNDVHEPFGHFNFSWKDNWPVIYHHWQEDNKPRRHDWVTGEESTEFLEWQRLYRIKEARMARRAVKKTAKQKRPRWPSLMPGSWIE